MPKAPTFKTYKRLLCKVPGLHVSVDLSRMNLPPRYLNQMAPAMQQAFDAMDRLEAGAIANPDENRMVGHYWLRDPDRAPTPELRDAITTTIDKVKAFAANVHNRRIKPPRAPRFTDLLLIGIGGSALGPQLVADAMSNLARRDRLRVHFLDNTDPDGMLRTLKALGARLKATLVLVVSKSGGTPEPRNAMTMTRAAFDAAGLHFPSQAVAITGEGSKLDQIAVQEGWLERFPMWDWVGGRTSVTATVGLVPAALQGIHVDQFLDGAARMDAATRQHEVKKNPAALLALAWHHATGGRGEKAMVMLPYKDRLILLSRYLQQLVMESLGKKHDLDGNLVHQGISVYGNKGSTDQHAYVQQLRDGVPDFFVTFIQVLEDTQPLGKGLDVEVEPKTTPTVSSGDYLLGFLLGTRQALYEEGRQSLTITIRRLTPQTLGALIALYERAVGFYASLVNINAYHQPGVEAGKKAAADVLDLQQKLLAHLRATPDTWQTPEEIAAALGDETQAETLHHLADHLAANKRFVAKKGNRYRPL